MNTEDILVKFNNIFFYGDNDSISAVSAGWYGAYLGIDKFPIEKIKQLLSLINNKNLKINFFIKSSLQNAFNCDFLVFLKFLQDILHFIY